MLEELEGIKKDLQEYLEIRFDLIRLRAAENISKLLSSAANVAILGCLLFFILFFLSFALGYFVAEKLQSNVLGFLSVGAIYMLLLLFFLFFRRRIIDRPIIRSMVKLFFTSFSGDEKE